MVTYYSRHRTSIQCVCYIYFRSNKMGDVMNPVWICRLSADRSSNIGTSLKHFIRCLFSFLFFFFSRTLTLFPAQLYPTWFSFTANWKTLVMTQVDFICFRVGSNM